jgi:hypothetical protein
MGTVIAVLISLLLFGGVCVMAFYMESDDGPPEA